jgi:hypothetical protein
MAKLKPAVLFWKCSNFDAEGIHVVSLRILSLIQGASGIDAHFKIKIKTFFLDSKNWSIYLKFSKNVSLHM